jgi:hypothetical protein
MLGSSEEVAKEEDDEATAKDDVSLAGASNLYKDIESMLYCE